MTPKEKANQLADKYFDKIGVLITEETIDCALITVEEILNLDDFSQEGREYWQQVKIELERL